VSKRDRMVYEKMADLFSENNNRQKLREYMNSTKLPVIPYLGKYVAICLTRYVPQRADVRGE